MIKSFLYLFLICLSLEGWTASKNPHSETGLETGIEIRAMKKWKRYLFLAETKNRNELLDTEYHQLMLGSYYRLTKRLRMGLFFQGEQGLRWDEDWKKDGTTWHWQNVQGRWDYSTVFDTTYANTFLDNWLWEIKGRLFYYHSRDALQLRARPGLRYFVLKEGKPLMQIYSEIEAYMPLNYGESSLYEYWIYLGSLFQVTQKFSIGPVISYRGRWIHSYDSFEEKTGTSFESTLYSTYLGLNAVYVW